MLVEIGPLGVADGRVVADADVVDDRDAEPHGKVGSDRLDRRLRCSVRGGEAPLEAVVVLGHDDVGHQVALDAGFRRRRLERRALQVAHEPGKIEPRQQPMQVRLVDGDGVCHPIAEALGDLGAIAREQVGPLVGDDVAHRREPVRAGEVVEGDHGRESQLDAPIDDGLVVVECVVVEHNGLGFDPSPLDAEPIGVAAQAGDQIDVLGPQLVGVAGEPRGLPEHRRLLLLEEPDVGVVVAALHLMAGRGDTPPEVDAAEGVQGCRGHASDSRRAVVDVTARTVDAAYPTG